MGNNVGALKDSSSEAAEVKLAEARRLITECSDDELLQGLSRERDLFSLSNPEVIKLTPEENPNTVHQMVSGWGAYWHTWKGTLECPHCKVDLRDHKSGPPGVRQIGVIVEDRVAYWVCPDCNGQWTRE